MKRPALPEKLVLDEWPEMPQEEAQDLLPSFTTEYGPLDRPTIESVLERYRDLPRKKAEFGSVVDAQGRDVPVDAPYAMRVRSKEELQRHMETVLRLCVANRARYAASGKDFPNYQCVHSGRNVVESLLLHGYPNAAFGYDAQMEHGVVLLPFVMDGIEGTLLAEPTAAQLWLENAPEATVEIKRGTSWKHRTEWKSYALLGMRVRPALFPCIYTSLDTLRRSLHAESSPYSSRDRWLRPSGYFAAAFANPVDVAPDP